MPRYLAICLFVMLFTAGSAQPIYIGLDSASGCTGDTIEIDLLADNFNHVGSLTLYISYDPNVLLFDSTINLNPQLPGMLVNNIPGAQCTLCFAWFTLSMNPANLGAATLATIRFVMIDDNTTLDFLPLCEITDSIGQVLQAQYTGSIIAKQELPFIQQPQNVTAYPGNSAGFSVQTSTSGVRYQWQRSSDGVLWDDLTDDLYHAGTSTDNLTISDLTLAFHHVWYRCRLNLNHCEAFSDSALLLIDTAQSVKKLLTVPYNHQPYPNPFDDHIIVPFQEIIPGPCTFTIYDFTGRLIMQKQLSSQQLSNTKNIEIHDLVLQPGYYFLTLDLTNHHKKTIQLTYPIVKK